ncbi:type I-E CRISPR-associated protein Cse1/CasA [Aeromonas caviae]|uniref:type I-E CRISPR-associated protein Cse1/CasA n=1 Tax=Aeromonas caviae TaxID=648 RepID=UPI001B3E3AD9|nr:type I-E CRISPR-associated protein Cse1/CasA [Aeromonadaceae bacterium]
MISLIHDPWLPVRLRDGARRWIRPAELVDEQIIELAWPRADFQGAGYQFLIGLLQASVAPEDRSEWEEIWDDGLDGDHLACRLAELAPAFSFGAIKPAFMQDFDSLEVEPLSIANLLIEAPGGNTLKLNKDHFVKRGSVVHVCLRCAAMALFTLQVNAPSGGQGHRTSLRGGGPITSLVWPQQVDTPLWRRLWLNVLSQEEMPAFTGVPADVFPWMAATRTSEQANLVTTPELSHRQQAYWGMPRRVEIDFDSVGTGSCDLCGEPSELLLSQYRTKNYGVQYDGWVHPLTPYRQDLKVPGAPLLSVKGQPGGLLYRDWLGLLWQGEGERSRELPAAVVAQAQRFYLNTAIGLWCFGYDMDNMKARCWYQHSLPLRALEPGLAGRAADWLRQAAQAAQAGLLVLRGAVKAAWNNRPKDAKGDFSFIDIAFWQETEGAFMSLLDKLCANPDDPAPLADWGRYLRRQLLQRFDALVLASPELALDLSRELKARKDLYAQLGKTHALAQLAKFNHKETA